MPIPNAAALVADMDAIHELGGWTAPLCPLLLRLAEAQAEWQPPGGGHPIISIVRHLSFWHDLVLSRMQGMPMTPAVQRAAERLAGNKVDDKKRPAEAGRAGAHTAAVRAHPGSSPSARRL